MARQPIGPAKAAALWGRGKVREPKAPRAAADPRRPVGPPANVFHSDVRDALRRAASTPGSAKDRAIAIEKAIGFAKVVQPKMFKKD